MDYHLRVANSSDRAAIGLLIDQSSRAIGLQDYSAEQIEGALKAAWGLDNQLVTDRTYFVVESGATLVGCGGWSYRATLFGGDSEQSRSPSVIDPATGAAKIRAFFVSSEHARRGIGSLIMRECEDQARQHGYRALELMATLPGKHLYQRHGFVAGEPIAYPLPEALTIQFVPMSKVLTAD